MLDKIEHNISQNAGLGFFIALTICSFFVLGVWKVREALDENN